MYTIRTLLFDHGCVVVLCEEWFMLAKGARGTEPVRAGGCWAAWCGWPAGRQAARGHAGLPYREATGSCRAPRRHRNLPRAQDKQGLLLLRSQAGSEGVLTEEEYFVKNSSSLWPTCYKFSIHGLCHFCNGEEYQ